MSCSHIFTDEGFNARHWLHFCRLVRRLSLSPVCCHSCPFSHLHHNFFPEPAFRLNGVLSPFFDGWKSFAKCGWVIAMQFCDEALKPLHVGHAWPPKFLEPITDCHSCPFSQSHQALWPDPAVKLSGVSGALLNGCHSAASEGLTTAKEFSGKGDGK